MTQTSAAAAYLSIQPLFDFPPLLLFCLVISLCWYKQKKNIITKKTKQNKNQVNIIWRQWWWTSLISQPSHCTQYQAIHCHCLFHESGQLIKSVINRANMSDPPHKSILMSDPVCDSAEIRTQGSTPNPHQQQMWVRRVRRRQIRALIGFFFIR